MDFYIYFVRIALSIMCVGVSVGVGVGVCKRDGSFWQGPVNTGDSETHTEEKD